MAAIRWSAYYSLARLALVGLAGKTFGPTVQMIRFLGALGVVLLLGGIGHSAGVLRLYASTGLPDANRILVDIWVGQAQFIAGALYLTAFRRARRARAWRALATFGALTMIGFGAAMLPVFIARAPVAFRVPTLVYVVCSVLVLVHVARVGGPQEVELANTPLQPASGAHSEVE